MGLIADSLRYCNIGYLDQPDISGEVNEALDKAELYFKWGLQSNEKNDFHQAFSSLISVSGEKLTENQLLNKYEKTLKSSVYILSYELKEIVEVFNFLVNNKLRIELRDIDYSKQLAEKMFHFMDIENKFQGHIQKTTVELNKVEFSVESKAARMQILEKFEGLHSEANEGIQAFYSRVKDSVVSKIENISSK